MDNDAHDSRLVALALGSFFPGESIEPISNIDLAHFQVSTDWQLLGPQAKFAEIRGHLAKMPHGYMAEILGRAAAAGEQLGLALTAARDAEVWQETVPTPEEEPRRTLAGRALAEASGLWSISTGHAAVNVVARIVRAHPAATHLDSAWKWNGPPTPFTTDRRSNLSLNDSVVKALARAATDCAEQALTDLVAPLRTLIDDADWMALTDRRDIGYHRWRPQSIEGGTQTTNPWTLIGNNTASLTVGVTTGHVPPTLETLAHESRAGFTALSRAMREVHNALPMAMASANIGLWKTS